MRTTFNIEDGLLEEARSQARQRKTTLGAVISAALRLGLLRSVESCPAAATAPLKTFRGDGLQAGIDLSNSSELLDSMERP
ncbi:MAG: hypothetical protein K8R87_05890 [Verrucomicrobia bacterium]|nr:hypothetical protein [Verrucomicrobiota bacterium]